jgi:hypothetical protein
MQQVAPDVLNERKFSREQIHETAIEFVPGTEA